MKITVEGEASLIKPYFVQTLCMLFFPGENFSTAENTDTSSPRLSLHICRREDGVEALAEVSLKEKTTRASHTEPYNNGEPPEKTAQKAAGRAIYLSCAALVGYEPEWGTLTGVRPSKLVMKSVRQGAPDGEIIKKLGDEYLVSPKKALLAASVARREIKIIDSLPPSCCGLYISIPFCPTRCSYCSFVSYSTPRLLSLIPDYLERLFYDIDMLFETADRASLKVCAVYIGGGTPTVLDAGQIDALLKHINKNLGSARPLEFTLEAGRPDTVTAEKLAAAAENGVTRVSVNPQTLDDKILEGIGRRHTCGDFYTAYDTARKSGIKYINTDLIAGLPGDNAENFTNGLEKIIGLRPDNITVHTFCVKKSASVKEELGASAYAPRDIQTSLAVDAAQRMTAEAGYVPYYMYRQKNAAGSLENVGFSLLGAEGIYNVMIMEETHTILAAGAGAVTKLVGDGGNKIERLFMPKYPYEYLASDAAKEINAFKEKIDAFYARRQSWLLK